LEARFALIIETRHDRDVVPHAHELSRKIEKESMRTAESAEPRRIKGIIGQREEQNSHPIDNSWLSLVRAPKWAVFSI
jgi:hypothetical protein